MSMLARALLADLGSEDLADLAQRLAPFLPRDAADGWMNSRDAAAYLGISKAALHHLTAARRIPFTQGGPGEKLFFKRTDLDAFREGGR